jgi:hypothetical protein
MGHAGKGGYFNRAGRRGGGPRPFQLLIPAVDAERFVILRDVRAAVAATGLDGVDLMEVYERLDATETDVLKDCLAEMRRR